MCVSKITVFNFVIIYILCYYVSNILEKLLNEMIYKCYLQPDQIKMSVFFLVTKGDLSSVRYCTAVHETSNFLQSTRNTQPCLTGQPVY